MLNSGYRVGSRWYSFIVVFLSISFLAACGGDKATSPEPAATLTPTTAATSVVLPTPTPPMAANVPLDVNALSMTRSLPDQGWITYTVQLAVHNTSESPIILSNQIVEPAQGAQTGPVTVTLQGGNAAVDTDQGELYFAEITIPSFDPLVIPAGMAVSSPSSSVFLASSLGNAHHWSFDSFVATFRVPELLHPTLLGIRPGIVHNGVTTPVNLDLANLPEQNAELVNPTLNGATQLAPFESGPLAVEMTASPGTLMAYHPVMKYDSMEGDSRPFTPDEAASLTPRTTGLFVSVVDVTIKNTDITRDQPVNLDIAVLDGFGTMYGQYRTSDLPTGECSTLPASLGPGQSFTGRLCFEMPEDNALGTTPLGLLVTTLDTVQLFALQAVPETLTNCTQPMQNSSSFSEGQFTFDVSSGQTITVPESDVVSVDLETTIEPRVDRITIEASGGEAFSIRVTPVKPDSRARSTWLLLMYDPSGVKILRVLRDLDENDPSALVVENVFLHCQGSYNFYIWPYGGYRNLDQDITYPVTVTFEPQPAGS